jgi:type II secretory pathway component PulF
MKEVIRQIQKDLERWKDGQEVYGKHEDVFGKFAAFMLGLASTSGNMALVLKILPNSWNGMLLLKRTFAGHYSCRLLQFWQFLG